MATSANWSVQNVTTPGFEVKKATFAIPPEVVKVFAEIVNAYATPVICFVGVFGNVVGLFVIRKDPDKKNRSVYTYLIALFAIDTSFLCLGFCITITHFIEQNDKSVGSLLRTVLFVFGGYMAVFLKHASAAVLILMSIERVLSLIEPYNIKDYLIYKYPRIYILVSLLISALYIIPLHLCMRIDSFESLDNLTIYYVYIEPNYFKLFIVYSYIEKTCFVLNSSTHRADFKHCNSCLILPIYKTVVNTTQGTRTLVQNNISLISRLALCTLYFICQSYFSKLCFLLMTATASMGTRVKAFFLFLGDFLARINAATDFVIYILV